MLITHDSSVRDTCGEGEVGSWLKAFAMIHWFREVCMPSQLSPYASPLRLENRAFIQEPDEELNMHLGFLDLQALRLAHGNFCCRSFPGMHGRMESTCASEGILILYSWLSLSLFPSPLHNVRHQNTSQKMFGEGPHLSPSLTPPW